MHKLCWWAVPCSGAIFAAVYLLPESLLFPVGGLCVLGAALSRFFHGNIRRRLALAASGLAVGLLWSGCYAHLFRAPAHALAGGPPSAYTLTVTGFPSKTSRGAAFSARLLLEGHPDPKVQVYGEADAMDLRPGDVVRLTLSLSPSDFFSGGSTDYYQSKGVYLLGYASDSHTLLRRPDIPPVSLWPQYAAKQIKDALPSSFPQDVSGVVTALLTGDKSQLPTGLYAAFRRAGLAHVMAVSGLHIGFLTSFLTFFLGRRKRLGTVLTLTAVFFFAALAGNSPSALRAAFMVGVISLAPLVGREDDKPTTLSAVLVLMLLQCPYAASSVSLQLSFSAMAGIYLVSERLNTRWRKHIPKWDKPLGKLVRRLLSICAAALSVSLGALLFTTPLSALYFRSVSLVGPLTNLLSLWAASAAFIGGLLTALTGLVLPGVAPLLGWVAAWPVRWLIFVAEGFSRLPFSSVPLLSGYMVLWFAVSYVILLIWLLSAQRIRSAVSAAALLLCLCPALIANAWPTLSGELTLTALDVGQGASTLIRSRDCAVLVDCGGNCAGDPGDVAADYLQSLGTSKLDALILTHFHSDHTNGVPELLERLDVPLLIVPKLSGDHPDRDALLSLAAQYGCEIKLISDNTSVRFGRAGLTLYAPLGGGGENEEGLSVLCTFGDFDALITGDMNAVVEGRLIKYNDLPDIELLFAGHHGSKSSTSEALLFATAPDSAVISCGYNTYGHPSWETLERLGAAGCDIYRTDLMGNITFTIKEEKK